MSRRPAPTVLLATALLAALPVASALAQQAPPQEPQARRATLSDAVRQVERDTRGEVLSAERVQYDGRDMHRVKVVDNQGRVRVFMQDPQQRGDRARRAPPAEEPRGRGGRPTRDDDN